MLVKSVSVKLVSRFSIICTIAIALLLLGPNPANAESRRDAVADSIADRIFYGVNSQLNNRKLQSDDYQYIREWKVIREFIYRELKPSEQVCFRPIPGNWEFPVSSQNYDRIADVIFYHRNPQMNGRKIQVNDLAAKNEWTAIKRGIHIFFCGI